VGNNTNINIIAHRFPSGRVKSFYYFLMKKLAKGLRLVLFTCTLFLFTKGMPSNTEKETQFVWESKEQQCILLMLKH